MTEAPSIQLGAFAFQNFQIMKKLTLINPEWFATIIAALDQFKMEAAREVGVQSLIKESRQHTV